MTIRRLPEHVVNRIAAGEVIERPASAVKELVENSLDAGATRVDVHIRDGGKSLISVVDDGIGMTPDELRLAVERHATSKLPQDALDNIQTLGFRGEALPSIGSVGRLSITSRTADSDTAWRLDIEGGDIGELSPAPLSKGTRIELRDLFYATPARLKFLRADRTESSQVADAISRLAMARPDVSFTLIDSERTKIRLEATQGDLLDARLRRLSGVMGKEFAENALPIEAEREGLRLTGYAGLPTLNRGNAQMQFLFVNDRSVKDRLLFGAVRGAYADFLARDRHPLLALFLEIDAAYIGQYCAAGRHNRLRYLPYQLYCWVAATGCDPADNNHGNENKEVQVHQQPHHSHRGPCQQCGDTGYAPLITGEPCNSGQEERLNDYS